MKERQRQAERRRQPARHVRDDRQRERPIYEAMKAQDPNAQRGTGAKSRRHRVAAEFFSDANPTFQRMYSGRRAVGDGQGTRGIPATRAQTSGQLACSCRATSRSRSATSSGTAIMLRRPRSSASCSRWSSAGRRGPSPRGASARCRSSRRRATASIGGGDILKGLESTRDHTGAVFFLVVAAVWFGTSNAAREIVSERSIYLRERMVNLGLVNYVFSKYILLAGFCVIQCTVLLAIVFFALGFHGGPAAFGMQLASLVATSLSAVALGLLLSTVVSSSEAAMALTPIALIPQVVLGG
jgi:hypothetical protein